MTILAMGGAIYLSGYLLIGKAFVPQSFKDARVRAAESAAELVALLNESSKSLEQINDLDRRNQYLLASEMVEQELQRSATVHAKAIELSNEFSTMAESLGAVTPIKARNLANEAIKEELKLIQKIIGYNSLLSGLLQNLELKFSTRVQNDEVQKGIETMNAYAKEINELNASYNAKMEEFDNLTK